MNSAKLQRPVVLLLGVCALVLTGCSTPWRAAQSSAAWTLYVRDGSRAELAPFEESLDAAFEAVEAEMGPFERRVKIHAWDDELEPNLALRSEMEDVPGIGPARVRAFHVRGGANLFAATGVFLGTPEVGTAVHELVHARLAEESFRVPLWFEEGLASLLGDGACFDDRWVVDGLACWPLRELREERIDDAELLRLLDLSARDDNDARENLLVHFVGWAIVFDLALEDPDGTWRQWMDTYERGCRHEGRLTHSRRRLERTLRHSTHETWLERLSDPDAGTRLAAAKGTWKLRSRTAVDCLLDALESEEDPQVRYGLALNAFLATTEMRIGRSRGIRMRELVFPVLRRPQLPDAKEQTAAEDLYAAIRWSRRRRSNSQQALESLSRFWEE